MFLKNLFFSKEKINTENSLLVNEEQVKNYKESQLPNKIKVVKYNNSWLWGKTIKKVIFGIPFRVFYVGGIQLETEADIKPLINNTFKIHKAMVIQLTSCSTNSNNKLFKRWKPSLHMNGFIFCNLNMPEFSNLNLMIGCIDVF